MRRLALLTLVALLACATPVRTGVMAGRWTPKHGETQPVPMGWESIDDSHGAIHATLGPGGEHFNGNYVRVEADSPHVVVSDVYTRWYGPSWGALNWGPDGNYGPSGASISVFMHLYSGKVVATLFGNHGSSIRCHFTLNSPDAGLVGGGVGDCQVSDGSQIDVRF